MAHARYRVNAPKVISETIDDEVVIINLQSGNYYSLMGSGARMWEVLTAGATLDELAGEVTAVYDTDGTDVAAVLDAFVSELLGEELVTPAEGVPDDRPALDPALRGTRFEAPVLERFTDMQDLILLDPVHDVEADAGWPRAKRPDQESGRAAPDADQTAGGTG